MLAKKCVHAVFAKYAQASPRFTALSGASQLELDLQLDVYRLSSRSHKVVRRRAKMAEAFFLDMLHLKINFHVATNFQVATWARFRVCGGVKSAGSYARQTLVLVEAATAVSLFSSDPLVKGQLQGGISVCGADEPAVQAKEVSIDLVIMFENLVLSGESTQIRCYAGLFALFATTT